MFLCCGDFSLARAKGKEEEEGMLPRLVPFQVALSDTVLSQIVM